eukprot:10281789-Lingulodinium_polyedra.AAC.1
MVVQRWGSGQSASGWGRGSGGPRVSAAGAIGVGGGEESECCPTSIGKMPRSAVHMRTMG